MTYAQIPCPVLLSVYLVSYGLVVQPNDLKSSGEVTTQSRVVSTIWPQSHFLHCSPTMMSLKSLMVSKLHLAHRLPGRIPKTGRLCCVSSFSSTTHRQSTERKGFGSFHSEDIEVLIRQSDTEFIIPPIHSAISTAVIERFALTPTFTSPLLMTELSNRKALFALDPNWTFINQGAFGAALKPLLFEAFLWREYAESQPLRFHDRELFPLLAHSLRCMAKRLQCDAANLVPLVNVTAGMNAICRTMAVTLPPAAIAPAAPAATAIAQQADSRPQIAYLSLTYGSTKKMLTALAAELGYGVTVIPIPLPITSQASLMTALESQLASNIKLIVLDAITSNTACCLPVLAIAKKCKLISPDAVVVIDAAHALFSQQITLESSQLTEYQQCVDYWLTNGHKWLSAPKGCAVMWTNPSTVQRMRPAIISHGYTAATNQKWMTRDHFISAFAWDGCRDYAALLCLPSALSVWDELAKNFPHEGLQGWDVYRQYIMNLLDNAELVCEEMWGTSEADYPCPKEMRVNSPMRLLPLPQKVLGKSTRQDCTDRDAFQLQEKLYHDHQVEVPVKCLEGKLYVRISAHIYNSLEDYQKLAIVIRNMP